MDSQIYMWPANADDAQRVKILQDEYQGTQFTDAEVAALDEVVQLTNKLGSTRSSRSNPPRPEEYTLALERGWVVATALGYEPTIEGRLAADKLRQQAGLPPFFLPWDAHMSEIAERPSCFLPAHTVPMHFVLDWLNKWEGMGCSNEVVVRDGYCYLLLSLAGRFEKYPVTRFDAAAVEDYAQQGLIEDRGDGLFITHQGKLTLAALTVYGAETTRETDYAH